MPKYRLPLLFLSTLMAALPATAQQPSHACALVPDAVERLACYDRAFPPPPEVVEAAEEKAAADFGLAPDKDQPLVQRQPERIEGRVAKVDYAGSIRIVTLENGQAWTQTDARAGAHVKAGDVVQVRKAVLGGYTLVLPNGVSMRVRRTR